LGYRGAVLREADRPEAGRGADLDEPRSPFEARLTDLLSSVAAGEVPAAEAAAILRNLPFTDLGFAKVDHHRELRQGACEIVYGEGKTTSQVQGIVRRLLEQNHGPVLVTRADERQADAVRVLAGEWELPVEERPGSRALAIWRNVPPAAGLVMVMTAGTADLPVAEEAALTASVMGAGVDIVPDVGVAGLHRLAPQRERLARADAVVVVAGMEGALASVVGGLATGPVIACPTSVGYGASFGGLAALLAMLSSCTPGVVCVNIDDGVGAGYAAALVARRTGRSGNGS
jgi:pyridinium-3,5-biscarboxylic acid mononucleotide synthase